MIKLNGVEVVATMFPDKTSQIWKIDESILSKVCTVNWEFENEGEIVHLAQLKDLLDNYGFEAHLEIDYLPYARQDKEVSNSSTFALRSFAKILNSLKFAMVRVLDPHSEVAVSLIKNCVPWYPITAVESAFMRFEGDLVCYPDEGAKVKYANMYRFPAVFAQKVREPLTGEILRVEVTSDEDMLTALAEPNSIRSSVSGRRILIVDDICDGGATFIALTRVLHEMGALAVGLFVSHGIFSKGVGPLFEAGIERVFTNKGEIKK